MSAPGNNFLEGPVCAKCFSSVGGGRESARASPSDLSPPPLASQSPPVPPAPRTPRRTRAGSDRSGAGRGRLARGGSRTGGGAEGTRETAPALRLQGEVAGRRRAAGRRKPAEGRPGGPGCRGRGGAGCGGAACPGSPAGRRGRAQRLRAAWWVTAVLIPSGGISCQA